MTSKGKPIHDTRGNLLAVLGHEGVNAPVCCQMTGTGKPFATGTLVISFTIDEPTTSNLRRFTANEGPSLKTVVRVPSVNHRKKAAAVDGSAQSAKRCSLLEGDRRQKKSTASAAIVQYEKALASIGLHGFCQVQTVGSCHKKKKNKKPQSGLSKRSNH